MIRPKLPQRQHRQLPLVARREVVPVVAPGQAGLVAQNDRAAKTALRRAVKFVSFVWIKSKW
jgi:hypothetical protein